MWNKGDSKSEEIGPFHFQFSGIGSRLQRLMRIFPLYGGWEQNEEILIIAKCLHFINFAITYQQWILQEFLKIAKRS